MRNKKNILEHLINNELLGKNSKAESDLLSTFSSSFKSDHEWNEENLGNKQELADSMLKNIKSRIKPEKSGKKIQLLRYSISAAASILLLAAIALFFNSRIKNPELISFRTLHQMDSILLQDGSKIYLSPNTEIQYNTNYNKKLRAIDLLSGNAFFKVAKNPNKPFIVYSGEVVTKVLGTSFNVSLLHENCKVTVYTGKVNVTSPYESINILPLQELSFNNITNTLTKNIFEKSQLSEWFLKDLELNNTSIEHIIHTLEYKYGVEFRNISDEVKRIRATINIDRQDSIQEIINQINYITNLKFEANGKIISIKH
ncbi:FecR family protein [Marinifilum sp.]|uniref:FecR family protein n=1 Tax=Marinifilum sp. TaxID=2033137 RepID=UPI003BAC324C